VEFIRLLALAVYFGTPVFIIYAWVRLAKSRSSEVAWPMATALGLWLLQAAVLLYFIAICLSGHCTLTPLEEIAPLVLLGIAYLAIAWLLWFAWRQSTRTAART
jgi:hypothetical protein